MHERDGAAPVWPTEAARAPARASLSGWLLTAAVILFVMGALSIIGALFIGVIAIAASGAPVLFELAGADEMLGAFMTIVAAFGIVLGVAGLLHIVAGVGVMKRSTWGRVLGMVVAVLGVILTVVPTIWGAVPTSMTDPLTGEPFPPPTAGDIILSVAMTAVAVGAYVLVLVVLVRRGAEFNA